MPKFLAESDNAIIVIASVVSVVLVVAIAVVAVTIIILTLVLVRVKRKQAALLQHNYEIPQLPTSKMSNYYFNRQKDIVLL